MSAPAAADRLRLFLALDLPAGARAALAGWRDAAVRDRAGLRPVADEALHVTLVFLGGRPQAAVRRIWRIAESSLAGLPAPELSPAGYRLVPSRRPRVLAVDLEDAGGRASVVHEALASALERAGLYEPERRTFWPHVTAARVRSRATLGSVEAPKPPVGSFTATEVTLYRSDLHPAGARYVALERLELH